MRSGGKEWNELEAHVVRLLPPFFLTRIAHLGSHPFLVILKLSLPFRLLRLFPSFSSPASPFLPLHRLCSSSMSPSSVPTPSSSSSASTPPLLAPPAPGFNKPAKGSKIAPQLTPEQEAKKLARAAAKALAAAGGGAAEGPIKRSKEQLEMGKFLTREWVNVGDAEAGEGRKVKIGSWNVSRSTRELGGEGEREGKGNGELTFVSSSSSSMAFVARRCSHKHSFVSPSRKDELERVYELKLLPFVSCRPRTLPWIRSAHRPLSFPPSLELTFLPSFSLFSRLPEMGRPSTDAHLGTHLLPN